MRISNSLFFFGPVRRQAIFKGQLLTELAVDDGFLRLPQSPPIFVSPSMNVSPFVLARGSV
jgi:hypothetical protein